jgi:hypothetical protein
MTISIIFYYENLHDGDLEIFKSRMALLSDGLLPVFHYIVIRRNQYIINEADVSHIASAAFTPDDAEGDAGYVETGGRPYSYARLYGGADAGFDAQSNGQSDAEHDRRCGATGHPADDKLFEGKNGINTKATSLYRL